jgi:TolB-like protein
MVVEDNNLPVQVSALRKLLGAEAISTVQGRGYRFTATPVESHTLPATPVAANGVDLPVPDKPSIAVLPFTNMSGDPAQEYFSDGITEEIITALSRFHSLLVIARNSSFTYKDEPVDVRAVGRELGVRYVLEGRVRRAANRVRVTAQLIDTLAGTHLWADNYDRVLEDIFAVQEEVTGSIVGAIAPEVAEEERLRARRKRPDDLSAYDLALRASADAILAPVSADAALRERALSQARDALSLDPCCSLALELIGRLQARYLLLAIGSGADWRSRWDEAVAAATKAIAIDPASSVGYACMAHLLSLVGRGAEALVNARLATALNPNDAYALHARAEVEVFHGQPDVALEYANRVCRLSPRDPSHYIYNLCRAGACDQMRDHAKALEYAHLAAAAAPNSAVANLTQAVYLVVAEEFGAARDAFDRARRINPEYVQARLEGRSMFHRPEDVRRYLLAVRIAAGLEDPAAAEALR